MLDVRPFGVRKTTENVVCLEVVYVCVFAINDRFILLAPDTVTGVADWELAKSNPHLMNEICELSKHAVAVRTVRTHTGTALILSFPSKLPVVTTGLA